MLGSGSANTLLISAALAAVDQFELTFVILDDFNADPAQLVPDDLLVRQIRDLKALHARLYGQSMPCTCKGATWIRIMRCSRHRLLLGSLRFRWCCHQSTLMLTMWSLSNCAFLTHPCVPTVCLCRKPGLTCQ